MPLFDVFAFNLPQNNLKRIEIINTMINHTLLFVHANKVTLIYRNGVQKDRKKDITTTSSGVGYI